MEIVYNTFGGRFSDSPRALYEALSRRGPEQHHHVWLADPAHLAAFPAEIETVPYGSAESVAALEAADLLIANTHTEVEWEKPPGAIYLQTWHGTPLKRIHWDVLWAPEGRLDRLQRDVDRWDYLVSPNRASTELLRGAFRFTGEILETGYPRNDVLQGPERDEIRARVRSQLGLADGTTAVLYTPTWRDDEVFGDPAESTPLHLDVDAFTDALGEAHSLLLRLHYMVADRLRPFDHPGVSNVSGHADVSELYLAADVLVTDYSSTMFDFAVTGKPLLFYTYDLAYYESQLRGFYFDFAPEAPGPMLQTTPELLDALRDLPAVSARYADRYARFRERFCHLEDGHATDRVLARVAAD